MKRINKAFMLCLFISLAVCSGCAYQNKHVCAPNGLPEEVIIATTSRVGYKPNIAVLIFESPRYASGTGEKAADFLYSEALRRNIPANFTYIGQPIVCDPSVMVEFAKENRFEFIISGKVLYYLNGGISTASCAEQEIKVYRLSGDRLHTVGYAKALEKKSPMPTTYFIFDHDMGQPAPSAELMMKQNALKFVTMLDRMFPRY